MPRLTPAASEVLGALAALVASGPHPTQPLRRRTRLTPGDFETALHELDAFGLVRLQGGGILWMTSHGERLMRQAFA